MPELAKRYPPQPEKVATVRLRERPDFDRREGRGIRDVDGDDEREYDAQTAYLRNAPGAKHVPKGAPAYKGYVKTRLGATNVATLERGELVMTFTPGEKGARPFVGERYRRGTLLRDAPSSQDGPASWFGSLGFA